MWKPLPCGSPLGEPLRHRAHEPISKASQKRPALLSLTLPGKDIFDQICQAPVINTGAAGVKHARRGLVTIL